MTERAIIIDGTNIFYRAYVVNPSLSTDGRPVGGLVGFLKTLQKLIREMKPTKVFVCWDGAGGSALVGLCRQLAHGTAYSRWC